MTNAKNRISPGPGQESVWDYPRPPRIEDSTHRIQIMLHDQVIADSVRTKRVLETSHPPVYYIPPDDVEMARLRPAPGGTWCEWKGQASYYDIVIQNETNARVAWTYSNPNRGFESIQHYIAFYPSKMDRCTVDGEAVRAQEGDYYGGWITSDTLGPFKGAMGTLDW